MPYALHKPQHSLLPGLIYSPDFKRCSSPLLDHCFCRHFYHGYGLNVSLPKPLQYLFNRYRRESLMLSTYSPYRPLFSSLPQSPHLVRKTSSLLPLLDSRPRMTSSLPGLARSGLVQASRNQIEFCAFVSPLSTQDVSTSLMGLTS